MQDSAIEQRDQGAPIGHRGGSSKPTRTRFTPGFAGTRRSASSRPSGCGSSPAMTTWSSSATHPGPVHRRARRLACRPDLRLADDHHRRRRPAPGASPRARLQVPARSRCNAYIDDLVRPIAERGARPAGRAGQRRADGRLPGAGLGAQPRHRARRRRLGAARLRDWFWRLHQGVINFEGNPDREAGRRLPARARSTRSSGPVFDRLEANGTTARSRTCCTAACPAEPAGRAIS